MIGLIRKLFDKLVKPKRLERAPSVQDVRVGALKGENSDPFDLNRKPSVESQPRRVSTKLALQIGLDFGTHSTKIVIRRRGERRAQVVCVCDPVNGYPAFVVPSLTRVAQGSLWFGDVALSKSGGSLHRLLKLELLKSTTPPNGEDRLTDFLVTAYFGWILGRTREWIDARYGLENARLFLNVAAPMDHFENAGVKQRYLKIIGTAWELAFGADRKAVVQGINIETLQDWLLRHNEFQVPAASLRPYDVQPETIAPIVSLSQDPQMSAGMYLLVDMGAGTTELSINYVPLPGGNQNVLCYYDQSVLLGAERFQNGKSQLHLTLELLDHIWQTWGRGYKKDASNLTARQRWKSLRILLVGGGTCREDVRDSITDCRHAVHSFFPGEAHHEILRHHPADLDFGILRVSPEEKSLASVANGLAFPRMQWPQFFEPDEVSPLDPTQIQHGEDAWFLER